MHLNPPFILLALVALITAVGIIAVIRRVFHGSRRARTPDHLDPKVRRLKRAAAFFFFLAVIVPLPYLILMLAGGISIIVGPVMALITFAVIDAFALLLDAVGDILEDVQELREQSNKQQMMIQQLGRMVQRPRAEQAPFRLPPDS